LTTREIGMLFCKLLSIMTALYALEISRGPLFAIVDNSADWVQIAFFATDNPLLILGFALLLWFSASWIASKLLSGKNLVLDFGISWTDLQTLVVSLSGICLVVMTIPQVSRDIISTIHNILLKTDSIISPRLIYFSILQVSSIVKLGVGLFLFFKSPQLVKVGVTAYPK